jgi:hypothetical protein
MAWQMGVGVSAERTADSGVEMRLLIRLERELMKVREKTFYWTHPKERVVYDLQLREHVGVPYWKWR